MLPLVSFAGSNWIEKSIADRSHKSRGAKREAIASRAVRARDTCASNSLWVIDFPSVGQPAVTTGSRPGTSPGRQKSSIRTGSKPLRARNDAAIVALAPVAQ